MGHFHRTSDGARIPEGILRETEAFLDRVHDDLDKFYRRSAQFGGDLLPKSVGHYFEARANQRYIRIFEDIYCMKETVLRR